jgi:D-3-phosphoglycerate dehydrogenase
MPSAILVICPTVDGGALAEALHERLAAAGSEPVSLEVANGELALRDDVVALVTGGRRVTADELDRLPALRAVITASTGWDHLDLGQLGARGILAAAVADYCSDEVADHALAAVLSLWRGLPALARSVADGGWDAHAAGPLRRIAGSRLGIVGLGRVGRRLAAGAQALGIEVAACDPPLPEAEFERCGVRRDDLDGLLRFSDALSLHLPLGAGEAPLIGERELSLMREGAVLVDVARAQLVDLDALAAGLARGRPAAALLDVWPDEPPAPGDARLRAPNLVVTPHAAWYSPGSEQRLYERTADALAAVLAGREPDGRLV